MSIPNIVLVKMCGGHCSGNKHCSPTKKENKSITVKYPLGKCFKSFTVTVEEHKECLCMCKKKMNCMDGKFNEKTCSCKCNKVIIKSLRFFCFKKGIF